MKETTETTLIEPADYDTAEGITRHLDSLVTLNTLFRERHTAGYDRRERLTEFMVMGRFWLDSCGNCGRILSERGYGGIIPAEVFPAIPAVLTIPEWEAFRAEATTGNLAMADKCKSVTWSACSHALAPADAFCALCGEPWTIDDCTNMESHQSEANFDAWLFYHPLCYAAKMTAEATAWFRDRFAGAGFRGFVMRAIPNGYGSEDYRGPWFEVSTSVGVLVIGWRKRVVSIDWSQTGSDLLRLFGDVDDSKGKTFIHAWTAEQVEDYLRRLRVALEGGKP